MLDDNNNDQYQENKTFNHNEVLVKEVYEVKIMTRCNNKIRLERVQTRRMVDV